LNMSLPVERVKIPDIFRGRFHPEFTFTPRKVAMSITIRKAVPSDGRVILSLVEALAAYEKLDPPDREAAERLLRDLFSAHPRLECYLAELDGDPCGYAFVLETYSSFLALPTLYLEDLFVLPEARGRKAGYALFTAMVREAHTRGCGRMEWTVLDWNEPAINFYRRTGGRHMKEWQLYRLVKEDIERITGEQNG